VLDDRELCLEIEQLILTDVLKATTFDSLGDFYDAVHTQVISYLVIFGHI
jgi:hypothetical protein